MTLTRLCAALAAAGAVAIVVGAAMLWAAGVAVIVGGVLAIAGAALLYDPKASRR